jgi:hypothetical protein
MRERIEKKVEKNFTATQLNLLYKHASLERE